MGEAPGRLGADRTAVPFHGDVAGDNFENLLRLSGIPRRSVFVTNAVLCNPRDSKGNNAPPSRENLRNCAKNLKRQIDLIDPKVVVTLGAAALDATRLIEQHELTLKNSVRSDNQWNGRRLVPLYHPGARAMIHRSFTLQTADYYFVGELSRRLAKPRKIKSTVISSKLKSSWNMVRYILARNKSMSMFRLHKLFYLLDVQAIEYFGKPITKFYYIRQKDGPYCVELGGRWFKAFAEEVTVKKTDGKLQIEWRDLGLFNDVPELEIRTAKLIDRLLEDTEGLSDSQLKTRAYLTNPMKRILRQEKVGSHQLNKPLL
ncbi:hypothetical protein LCM05_09255 [Qipengyuania aquimaris]|nr:hypothetical protein LCM05_09255 [Qipengyuania aquimaris]